MCVYTNVTCQWQGLYTPMQGMAQRYTADNCFDTSTAMPSYTICLHTNGNACTHQCLYTPMTVHLHTKACNATDIHTHGYSRQYLRRGHTWYTPMTQIQQCLHCHKRTHTQIFTAIPHTQKYFRHTIAPDAAMSAMPQTYTPTDVHGNTSDTEILETHQWLRCSNACTATEIHSRQLPVHTNGNALTNDMNTNGNGCMYQCLFIPMTVPLHTNACRATEIHTDR